MNWEPRAAQLAAAVTHPASRWRPAVAAVPRHLFAPRRWAWTAPGDLWQAGLAAVLVEIPLALVLMAGAVRALRVVSALLWFSDPHAHSWEIQLPPRGRRDLPVDDV